MGGQAGGRGYLVQSLICVLDLVRDTRDWTELSVEPDVFSEKVDILWTMAGQRTAVQVKSSQNQINVPEAQRWASDLENSCPADHYELRLIGPCSDGVVKAGTFGKVKVPPPHPLNLVGVIEQAAHKLDGYFETKGISRVPPFARELLVNALVAKLSTYATNGTTIARSDLERMLGDWVLELYPQAINEAVEMQCTALWSLLAIPPIPGLSLDNPPFIAPLTFVNDGSRTVVIRDLIVVVSVGDRRAVYASACMVNLNALLQGKARFTFSDMVGYFSEFPVRRGDQHQADVVFVKDTKARSDILRWEPGTYKFELYALFADRDTHCLLCIRELELTQDFSEHAQQGENILMRFSVPNFGLDVT